MGQWGFHFERTITWWEQSAPWLEYLARCQYMLQQGLYAADAVYFVGESTPVSLRTGSPKLPRGYEYDGCNREVIMKRMTVKDGRIVLPDGMTYRMLILPPDETMTPELLRKIKQLVADGATVIGPRPKRSPSLQGYPECDDEVKALAAELWGKCDGKTVTMKRYGKGLIIYGKPMDEVLAIMRLKPDFESSAEDIPFIHRRVGDTDIFFTANPMKQTREVYCTFRVSGKTPELWDAETGLIRPAPVYSEKNGRITMPLSFEPNASIFVVFRKQSIPKAHFVAMRRTKADKGSAPKAAPKLVIIKAVYEAIDGTGSIDVTKKLASMVVNNTLSVWASNDIAGDPTPNHEKQLRVEYTFDSKAADIIIPENEPLNIQVGTSQSVPQSEVVISKTGRPVVTFWQAGSLEMTSASGKTLEARAAHLPENVVVTGPWEVRFPSDWGAPTKIVLPKLISWPEHADNGVKYFSGTATYIKDLIVPASMIGKGKRIFLDLGNVKNFAQVTINDQYLGTMWKPPFRVEITSCVHLGKNSMKIRVTNLWPNRLIGDEQLVNDREWNGMRLVKWPGWVLEGKPSPTGRFTFTTWHHYTKDSKLMESGLIGPVMLRPAQYVTVN